MATPEATQMPTAAAAPVYVYGVVRGGSIGSPAVDGVADRPVETIERDGLAAVTSGLTEERFRVRRRDLHRHLGVLEAAFAETTIVPCAFGMVLQSREAVERELLDARREELLAMLDRLEGRAQLNITAVYDEETVLREVVESDAQIARLRRQSRALGSAGHLVNINLGEAVASALAERREADASRIIGRLAAEADDLLVEEATATIVVRGSFLVQRDRAKRFDSALEALAASEAPRIRFESIGPLPPTAFATVDPRG